MWYIIAFLRSRFLPRLQKDGIRRCSQSRLAKPSTTTMICTSRFPPASTPIVDGDTPVIAPPTPILVQVRRPTILNPEDMVYGSHENDSSDSLGVEETHPPSIAGSGTADAYRASRPTARVRRPSETGNVSRRRARSYTPTSTRQSAYDVSPDSPELSQLEPQSTGSVHRDRQSVASILIRYQPHCRMEGCAP
jgi:hypothetical protein